MDNKDSSVIDAPHMKLAKVGKDRDRKRAGAGWLGARGAGSGFGALGGAGAGAGGLMSGGMTLGKLLMVLLLTAGLSAGAWQMGNMIAGKSSSDGKAPAPKLFADKDAPKYADTSGAIKGQNTIPNSLGYINNDGLTDEQRAAKKAADAAAAAAAAKAAADAQAKADADAKAKALADAKAAADAQAKSDADAKSAGAPRIGLGGNKFGGMNSSLGGGGGGLSGGAGMSGGIGSKFSGMEGLGGGKGQAGNLSAFSGASKVATTKTAMAAPVKSNGQGFGVAGRQAQMASAMTRSGLAGDNQTAASGASQPFDGGAPVGTTISGPGVGSGPQSGTGGGGSTPNPSGGGGDGGPINATPTCGAGQQMDSAGGCSNIAAPGGQNAAPYQWMIDLAKGLMMLTTILAIMALAYSLSPFTWGIATIIKYAIASIGAIEVGLGMAIIAMTGDKIIGGITAAVGALTIASAFLPSNIASVNGAGASTGLAEMAAGTLISNALGSLVASSAQGGSLMM